MDVQQMAEHQAMFPLPPSTRKILPPFSVGRGEEKSISLSPPRQKPKFHNFCLDQGPPAPLRSMLAVSTNHNRGGGRKRTPQETPRAPDAEPGKTLPLDVGSRQAMMPYYLLERPAV
jgi:hypothetical protein